VALTSQRRTAEYTQFATKMVKFSYRVLHDPANVQPFIYGFTAVHGFIAVTCSLVATFGDAHWAELKRPQRWAGVRTCPPRR